MQMTLNTLMCPKCSRVVSVKMSRCPYCKLDFSSVPPEDLPQLHPAPLFPADERPAPNFRFLIPVIAALALLIFTLSQTVFKGFGLNFAPPLDDGAQLVRTSCYEVSEFGGPVMSPPPNENRECYHAYITPPHPERSISEGGLLKSFKMQFIRPCTALLWISDNDTPSEIYAQSPQEAINDYLQGRVQTISTQQPVNLPEKYNPNKQLLRDPSLNPGRPPYSPSDYGTPRH
jgi:hypothetical protein